MTPPDSVIVGIAAVGTEPWLVVVAPTERGDIYGVESVMSLNTLGALLAVALS